MPEKMTISFELEPIPPFRLDYTSWCLRRRPENRIDVWDGKLFTRMLVLKGVPHLVIVQQNGSFEEPLLQVTVKSSQLEENAQEAITPVLAKLLGFERDLSEFYEFSQRNAVLSPMVKRFLGVKPPAFPTIFESILNGIVCQQISLSVCIQLLSRIAETYGLTDANSSGLHAFPRPEDLSGLVPNALRKIGLSHQKSVAIISLAQRVQTGDLDLEGIAGRADKEAEYILQQIKGVGPWTARYVLLRGLGRLHVFPVGDVGALNKLKKSLYSDLQDDLEIAPSLAPFHPFEGLLYFHLLLQDLSDRGLIHASPLKDQIH